MSRPSILPAALFTAPEVIWALWRPGTVIHPQNRAWDSATFHECVNLEHHAGIRQTRDALQLYSGAQSLRKVEEAFHAHARTQNNAVYPLYDAVLYDLISYETSDLQISPVRRSSRKLYPKPCGCCGEALSAFSREVGYSMWGTLREENLPDSKQKVGPLELTWELWWSLCYQCNPLRGNLELLMPSHEGALTPAQKAGSLTGVSRWP